MNASDDYRLKIWFSVLSLDAVSPFTSDMLLPVPGSFLTGPLRELIKKNRQSPAPTLPNVALCEAVVAALDALPEPSGSRFLLWYEHVATDFWNDRGPWALWNVLWRSWANGKAPAAATDGSWWGALVQRYAIVADRKNLRAQTEAARAGPLSEWDAEMFALHRFYETDDGEDEDPFLPVRNTIDFVRLRLFHREAAAGLSSEQVAALTRSAIETAHRIGYPLDGNFVPFEALGTS